VAGEMVAIHQPIKGTHYGGTVVWSINKPLTNDILKQDDSFKIILAFLSKVYILFLPFGKTIACARFPQDARKGAKIERIPLLDLAASARSFHLQNFVSILAVFF
jgi:hypothetical protein